MYRLVFIIWSPSQMSDIIQAHYKCTCVDKFFCCHIFLLNSPYSFMDMSPSPCVCWWFPLSTLIYLTILMTHLVFVTLCYLKFVILFNIPSLFPIPGILSLIATSLFATIPISHNPHDAYLCMVRNQHSNINTCIHNHGK